MRPLKREQGLLFIQPSRIAGQAPVGAKDPVAGDQDGDRVMPHRAAYGLGGHMGQAPFCGEALRQTAVCVPFFEEGETKVKEDERKKVVYVFTVCIVGAIIICCVPFLFHLLTN